MKRLLIYSIGLLLTLVLAGCIDIVVSTELKSNGSGIRSVFVQLPMPGMAQDLVAKLKRDRSLKSYEISTTQEGNVVAQRSFKNAKELDDEGIKATFISSGFFTTTYIYKEKLPKVSKNRKPEPPMRITFKIKMPGKIEKAIGGTSINANEAKWQILLSDVKNGPEFIVVSSETNKKNWTITIISLLGLSAIAAASILRQKKPQQS